MTAFKIIAVFGFLGHIATLALWWMVYSFSNRNVYEGVEKRMSYFDGRLVSFSVMVLGIVGWAGWKPFAGSYWKSFMVGIVAALLAEVICVFISGVYNTTKFFRYQRDLAEMIRSTNHSHS